MTMATRTWVIPVIMILCGRTLISSRGGTGVLGHEVDNYLWRYKEHLEKYRDIKKKIRDHMDEYHYMNGTYTLTHAPTHTPTAAPTHAPTDAPTHTPTAAPTHAPTDAPTHAPTHVPTAAPTYAPTYAPTHVPTAAPTYAPTHTPTYAPTGAPCMNNTYAPTHSPTYAPTGVPTGAPCMNNTYAPTHTPTYAPTDAPTYTPTYAPTSQPTPNITCLPLGESCNYWVQNCCNDLVCGRSITPDGTWETICHMPPCVPLGEVCNYWDENCCGDLICTYSYMFYRYSCTPPPDPTEMPNSTQCQELGDDCIQDFECCDSAWCGYGVVPGTQGFEWKDMCKIPCQHQGEFCLLGSKCCDDLYCEFGQCEPCVHAEGNCTEDKQCCNFGGDLLWCEWSPLHGYNVCRSYCSLQLEPCDNETQPCCHGYHCDPESNRCHSVDGGIF